MGNTSFGRFAFGEVQFAYRKHYWARGAVCITCCLRLAVWMLVPKSACTHQMQGAFDKIDAELVSRKLGFFNLDVSILAVLRSWLLDRRDFIIVNGASSMWPNIMERFFCVFVNSTLLFADNQNAFTFSTYAVEQCYGGRLTQMLARHSPLGSC